MAPSLRASILCLVASFGLAGCQDDEPPSSWPAAPPIRQISETDLAAWSTISLALAKGDGCEPLAGQLGSFEELIFRLASDPKALDPLCTPHGLGAADFVAICEAIQVCLSIESGLVAEEETLAGALVPPPEAPEPPRDLEVEIELPAPPEPVAPEAAQPIEDSLPPSARANLALYRDRRGEIQRTLSLFRFGE